MELKRDLLINAAHTFNNVWIAPLWNWNSSCAMRRRHVRVFESHLYGIETCLALGFCLALFVWIAPLWNWNGGSQRPEVCAKTFESHLYGIETLFVSPVCTLRRRLNRTSMELKQGYSWTRFFNFLFESHLYGIETRNEGAESKDEAGVWIAPLWNWNIKILNNSSVIDCVWIAPLWNWNSCAPCTISSLGSFESHLYGIETWMWSPKPSATFVWIAPLWNWNDTKSCPILYSKECLNRTSMELKHIIELIISISTRSLNRTSMELKQIP